MSGFQLRPEQARVIDGYRGGYAAIAAVPGAGKTTTLSALAAELIGRIGPRQRVVIVTYQNAAVANFQRAVAQRLRERGLPEHGFMVRTLHSLASEVLTSVRHRVELDAQARVIDEADATRLLEATVHDATIRHHDLLCKLVIDSTESGARYWPANGDWILKEICTKALTALRSITGDIGAFAQEYEGYGRWLPFVLDVCCQYQLALRERGYMDFDGLVERAVEVLERDPALCQRLRARWPYLLEDEAQDSNPLLERMLTLIAGEDGNLVRVGDPNQSILTTFTRSSVEGFLRWIDSPRIQQFQLAGSSRSSEVLLELANQFVERVQTEFPIEESRRSALRRQPIEPVVIDGKQQNPPVPLDVSLGLQATAFKHTDEERQVVVERVIRYLEKFPDRTAAILVGSREAGYEYALEVANYDFPDDKIIRLLGGHDGRQVGLISRLNPIFDFLEEPDKGYQLFKALVAWSATGEDDRVATIAKRYAATSKGALSDLLYPDDGTLVETILELPADLGVEERMTLARLKAVPMWLSARLSQPHELLALIGATALVDEEERSLLDAIIATVEAVPPDPAVSRLQQLRALLKELQDRSRKLRGTYEDHEINIQPGTLTISTRHQAKGLEWDVVFAVGCDDFWFKGSLEAPRRHQKSYLGPFDPLLVARTEVEFAAQGRIDYPSDNDLTQVTMAQNCSEASEGLRVMYVTITRARQGLWLSWHQVGTLAGRHKSRTMSPVFPLLEDLVAEIREGRMSAAAD